MSQQEALRRATEAVERARARAEADPARPTFHFRPPSGWMNDPNGPLHWHGWYHLFYQLNPYGDSVRAVEHGPSDWGCMHWGHARSRDLVRWEHLPIALAPRTEIGERHCFSGSSWPREVTPVLLYSSVTEETGGYRCEQWAVECDSELTEFRRSPENPVLALGVHGMPRLRPEWRDPFIFEDEKRVFMVLAAALPGPPPTPVLPLFEAADESLLSWRFRSLLYRGEPGAPGLECPNLIRVRERHLLVVSPHGLVQARVGRFDPERGSFRAGTVSTVDHGPSFYATNRVAGVPGGRCVLLGWVRGWPSGRGWNGVLALPRDLSLTPEGDLVQQPVPELGSLRGRRGGLPKDTRVVSGGRVVPGVCGPCMEIAARIEPRGAARSGLRLRSRPHGDIVLEIVFSEHRSRALVNGEALPHPPLPGSREVRLFWDRSLAELFLQGGRSVYTLVIDTPGRPVEVEVFAEGGRAVVRSIDVWEIESVW